MGMRKMGKRVCIMETIRPLLDSSEATSTDITTITVLMLNRMTMTETIVYYKMKKRAMMRKKAMKRKRMKMKKNQKIMRKIG